jgi:hypothetical protein
MLNTSLTWQRASRHVTGFAGLSSLCRGRSSRLALAGASFVGAWALHQAVPHAQRWIWLGVASLLPLALLFREPSVRYVVRRLVRRS